MSTPDVYASNNNTVKISASATVVVVTLMGMGFLIFHRRKVASSRKPEQNSSSDSPVTDRPGSSDGVRFGETPKRIVTISRGIQPQVEVDNENIQAFDENFSTNAAVLSGSLSSSGQYHFSFRELEFADKLQESAVDDAVLGASTIQQDLRRIAEESSDEDTTFETTVGSQ